VNHGSLSPRIINRYGNTTFRNGSLGHGVFQFCNEEDFHNVVISLKSSNTRIMVESNRMMFARMQEAGRVYPLHLGVTEAGEGEDGRIRSVAGIGTLLWEGIGDTIRVSLTEDPELEIPVARKLIGHIENGGKSPGGGP
jgi:(E)-4-hydroxy-3-methylbut-2-enyl-diphosphate synthase